MKKLTLLFLAMAVLMTAFVIGCDSNPMEDYTKGAISVRHQAEDTQVYANLSFLQRSVQNFRAMNGRLPADLEEVKKASGMNVDVSKYNYDPTTGKVTVKQ